MEPLSLSGHEAARWIEDTIAAGRPVIMLRVDSRGNLKATLEFTIDGVADALQIMRGEASAT